MTSKYKSSATIIPLDQAIGKVLAHDMTEIRPGQFKGPAFTKGHIVREEDLPHLKRLGKEHLFVLHIESGEVHEDDAALRLGKALAGPGVILDDRPSEGKIALRSRHKGLLKVNQEALTELNLVPDISCSSRHTNTLVEKGEIIAATRAIPLVIDEGRLNAALNIAESTEKVFSVKQLSRPSIGLIITGNEVYSGLVEDKFAPLIRKKIQFFDCTLKWTLFRPDDNQKIVGGIKDLLKKKAGLIMVAGGMSVDPDDITRMAIMEAGAKDVVYGTPVLPGAMFLYGRIDKTPILGLPACVLFYKTTILDLVMPRVLAGEGITRRDLALMAHGGLCLSCKHCQFPVCPFGK